MTAEPSPAVRAAWTWLASRRGSGTAVVSASTITPDQTYAADWTGPVSGRFTPVGVGTPASGWQVHALVTTDTTYPVGSQPARTDHRFAFPRSEPGTKTFRLYDAAGRRVLAEHAPSYGLVRSRGDGDRCYAYDQGLAVLAALALDETAVLRELTEGLLTLQTAAGGFLQVAAVANPAAGDPICTSGDDAVATFALLRAAASGSLGASLSARTRTAGAGGAAWLLAQQRESGVTGGLIGAGTGIRLPDGEIDPAAIPTHISTEHNLDAWHTLTLAARLLDTVDRPPAGFARAADRVRDGLLGLLWDPAAGRFRQGWRSSGPDDADPLDVSSWGAIWLHAVGRDDLAALAIAHLERFGCTDGGSTGQRAYYPQPAFPRAPPNVWFEGTAGVGLARLRTGDAAGHARSVATLAAAQRRDGAIPYATRTDAGTDMTDAAAVASTAWFVLAAQAPSGLSIWD